MFTLCTLNFFLKLEVYNLWVFSNFEFLGTTVNFLFLFVSFCTSLYLMHRNRQGLTAEDLAVSDVMKEVFTQYSVHSCLQVSPDAIVSPHVRVSPVSDVVLCSIVSNSLR